MSTIVGTSENLSHDVIDRGGITAQQLLVVALCLFFNMLDGFDITAIAIVGGAISDELNLSPDLFGLVGGAGLFGMVCGAMLLAPASDIIGRRKMIILSIALVGVSVIFTAAATTFVELLILRVVSGLGAGAMLASQAALAAEYSPDKYKALSVAVVTSGYPMGAMMTSVIGAFIIPEYGWRGMFWFGGILTASMVLVAWALLPESLKYLFERAPTDALQKINRILKRLKKPPISEMPQVTKSGESAYGFIRHMFRLFQPEHRDLTLMLLAAFFLCFATLYFLMNWIPLLMEYSGFERAVGREAFFLFNLGGVIGIYAMGWASTKFKLTNLILYLSLSAGFGMIVFALVPNQLTLLLTLTFLIGVVQQGGFTGLYGVAAKAYPTYLRSTGIGWCIGLGRVGAVVGPIAAGYMIAGGMNMSGTYFIFAIPMVAGGIIAYRLHIK